MYFHADLCRDPADNLYFKKPFFCHGIVTYGNTRLAANCHYCSFGIVGKYMQDLSGRNITSESFVGSKSPRISPTPNIP